MYEFYLFDKHVTKLQQFSHDEFHYYFTKQLLTFKYYYDSQNVFLVISDKQIFNMFYTKNKLFAYEIPMFYLIKLLRTRSLIAYFGFKITIKIVVSQ